MKAVYFLIAVALCLQANASLRKKVRKLQETDTEEYNPDTEMPTGNETVSSDDAQTPIQCKFPLLYSYGILSAGPTNRTSSLCGDSVVASCCTHTSEEVIQNFWRNNNKLKIKQYIEGYVWLFRGILNHYQRYKIKAQKILEYPGSPKVCKKNAEAFISTYIDKSEIEKYTTDLLKAYENIAFTRKAFYCALCNADYQQFFDLQTKSLHLSHKFCEQLVQTTMVELRTRNEVYMTIFNSMSVIAECDPNSQYEPEEYKVDMRLGLGDQNRIEKCYESYFTKNQHDPRVFIDDCLDFCSGYSLTSATELFEGNFAKLYFLFRKLRQFNEALNVKELIFEQVDVTEKYDFSMISTEFFEANLKNIRFEKFNYAWGRQGLELFYIASKSKAMFGYGSAERTMGLVSIMVLLMTLLR